MTSIVINGNAYSDDGSTPQDMQHYGYLTHLLPMIGDTATVAGQVTIDAAQAALDAVTASNGALALRGTSTTSLAVSAGTKTLTTQTGKQFTAGNYVTISRTSAPTTLMHGVVTSYSGATLIVESATIAGSGTFTDWTIALSGAKGDTGPTGNGQMAYLAKTGTYTVTAADKGKLIDCTSGTFTLSFQACATLGADWTTYIRNSGTGLITLDPNGAETIDGAATYSLFAKHTAIVQCDGSVIRIASDVPPKQSMIPIFSSEAAPKTGVTVLEDISLPSYATGLTGGVTRVIYGNSLFLASVSTAEANIASSPDAVTWTLRAMPSSAIWWTATNGSNKFIASVGGSTAIASSTNGTTWASATSLPASSSGSYGAPSFNGDLCIVFGQTTSTCFTSSDNGATWSSAQTLPANATSRPFNVGGLFWYFASGTTAYTSSTGATGSWTARTLPVTPGAYTHITPSGALSISLQTVNSVAYETTDGINWTGTGVASPTGISPVVLNTVPSLINAAFGSAGTYHNGKWVKRVSAFTFPPSQPLAVGAGGVICLPAGAAGVMRFDPNGVSNITGIFEG